MSVKVMGRVWDADLKPNLKIVLLAYADAAEHDGTEVWPGWERIAKMTNYSQRSVGRSTADLLTLGVLIQMEPGHTGQRASYTIDLDHPILRVSQDGIQSPGESMPNDAESMPNDAESMPPVATLPSSSSVLSSRPLSEAETARDSGLYIEAPIATFPIVEMNGHDQLVWALVDAMGWNRDEITQASWGRLHKAAKDLEDVGAEPDEIARRCQVYRVNYRGATISPNAIAANWADLAEPRQPVTHADVEKAARKADMAQWVADTQAEEAASEALTP
jgi:hypothetical protein